MKKKIALIFLLCCALFIHGYSQDAGTLYTRLRGISNGDVDFFNVDGIEITSQILGGEFSKKNIAKKFKRYSIKENDLNQSDSSIGMQNFYTVKSEAAAPDLLKYTSYYFIDAPGKGVRAVTFASLNKTDKQLESLFITALMDNGIPSSVYESPTIDSINFAGRKIGLGNASKRADINNIQSTAYGQMNWSVHSSFDDASSTVENQYKLIKAKKGGKIISEEQVDVVFEGREVKAKKAIYDFKGVASLLLGTLGAKSLTIYFVAAPVRGNFVSCVMSYWNLDAIGPSGLPPLLEEVMKLKK